MLRSIEPHFKRLVGGILRLFTGRRLSSDISSRSFSNILVVRQHNQLGDMLCAVPLLRALRMKFPQSSITLMASPVNAEVMQNNRHIDHLVIYDKREFLRRGRLHLLRLRKFIKRLRSGGYELAIVPSTVSTSFTSDMLAYLSGAAIRIGASELDGRANPSAFFFNVPVKLDWRNDPHRAQTLRNLDIAQPLSLDAHNLSSEITLNDSEVRESREFILRLRGKGKISIGLHPGAGKVPNRWAAESFAELANILATELNASIVLTAGPMDDEPLKTVTKRLIVPYELIQNKPIRYVASIILHLNLFVTNDTGLMHVAGATGAPVLSLFGPTDPMQWAPCGTRNRYIVGREGKISSVSVREVLDTAKAMLSQEGRASATT